MSICSEITAAGQSLEKAATLAQRAFDASSTGNHQAVPVLLAASKEALREAKRASDDHLLRNKANDEN